MSEPVEFNVTVICPACGWYGMRLDLKGLEACLCPSCAAVVWPPKAQRQAEAAAARLRKG